MSLKLFLSLNGLLSMFLYTLFQKRLKGHSPESPVLVPQLIVEWIFIYLFICSFFVFLFYFIFMYLCIFSFFSFACLFFLFVLWLLILFLFFIGLFCSCVLLSLSFFSFWHGDFISLWMGLGLMFRWSESKISYLGVVYKFLNVGMDLVVIKELFIILYI